VESADSVAPFIWQAAIRRTASKLGRISEKVLTDQLRQLEADGVIQRHVTPTVPPMVDYSLNAEGEKLVPLMESLCEWGSEHFDMKPNFPRQCVSA
jgi:DNA-binding HxlR family transcriptional regulator